MMEFSWNDKYYTYTRTGHASAILNNKLWVLGGLQNNSNQSDVWVSNNGIGWSQVVAKAPWSARRNHTSVGFSDRIYVMGGNSNPQTNDIWRFDLNFDIDNIQTSSTIWHAGGFYNDGYITANVSVEVTNYTSNFANNVEVKFYHTESASSVVLDKDKHLKTVTRNIRRREKETFSTNISLSERSTYLFACIKDKICVNKKLEVDLIRWDRIIGGKDIFYIRKEEELPNIDNHTSVVYDDKIWVIGGSSLANGKLRPQFHPEFPEANNDVWHSSEGRRWYKLNNTSWKPRINHSSVVFDAQTPGPTSAIWVLGGKYNNGNLGNDVWYYDNKTWTRAVEKAPWPPRWLHTSVVFDNKIWVMGGESKSGAMNDVWYSSNGSNWERSIPQNIWNPRSRFSSFVLNNKLWVVEGSGLGDYWSSADGVSWSLEGASEILKRNSAPAITIDSRVFIAGGEPILFRLHLPHVTIAGYNGSNWGLFNNTQGRHVDHRNLSNRKNHSAVVFKDKIFLIGGYDGSSFDSGRYYYNEVWVGTGSFSSYK